MQKKVSIIIPVFNGQDFVLSCIDNLKKQTYENIEIVFVDDLSTDNTCELLSNAIEDEPRFILIKRKEHTDPFQCRKAGFEASSGDIIMFLDADDELIPEACEIVEQTMTKNNVDMFVYGSIAVGTKNISEQELQQTQKYLDRQPFSGAKKQLKINKDILFSKNSWTVSVWSKALKRNILQQAYDTYIPKVMLPYGQDMLQTLLVYLSTSSVYSDISKKLHRYTVGTGATVKSKGDLTLEKFSRIMGAAQTAKALKETIELNAEKIDGDIYQFQNLCNHHLLSNSTRFINFLPDENIYLGLELMYENWGPIMFDAPIFSTPQITNLIPKVIASCNNTTIKKSTIKTIAMYYPKFGVGGVQRCMILLSKILMDAGFQIVIITDLPLDFEKEKYSFPIGLKFTSLNFVHQNGANKSVSTRCQNWANIIKNNDIDVVYYASYNNINLITDLLAIKLLNTYSVLHMHSMFSVNLRCSGAKYFKQTLEGFRLVNKLVALSSESKLFFDALGIDSCYIPNPPTFCKDQATCPHDKPRFNRIIWCGRISGEKQPIEAIKIFAIAHKKIPDLKLAIVGDCVPASTALKEKMHILAEQLNCADAIEWTGFVEDIRPWLEQSDVMLSTSSIEGFAMTFIEAFSHGLPVVAYELKCQEPIRSPLAAKQVPQLDTNAASNQIIELLTNEKLYQSSSQAAFAEYSKFASFDQKSAWTNLFLSLTQNPKEIIENDKKLFQAILSTLIDHSIFAEEKIIQREMQNYKKDMVPLQKEIDSLKKENASLQKKFINKYLIKSKIVSLAIKAQKIINRTTSFFRKSIKQKK